MGKSKTLTFAQQFEKAKEKYSQAIAEGNMEVALEAAEEMRMACKLWDDELTKNHPDGPLTVLKEDLNAIHDDQMASNEEARESRKAIMEKLEELIRLLTEMKNDNQREVNNDLGQRLKDMEELLRKMQEAKNKHNDEELKDSIKKDTKATWVLCGTIVVSTTALIGTLLFINSD